MAKSKTAYFCQNCGAQHSQWMGQCPRCGEWNTLVEEITEKPAKTPAWQSPSQGPSPQRQAVPIQHFQGREDPRYPTTEPELDRVLGGGLVAGSVVLLGGEPGIGKSTLLLQMALHLPRKCLYVSGEESEQQVQLRARRLGIQNESCFLYTATQTQEIFQQTKTLAPELVVIDSIQTLHSQQLDSAPAPYPRSGNVPRSSFSTPKKPIPPCS